jgi:hypothetical protein
VSELTAIIWFRVGIDPVFPPPPVSNSNKHKIPDALDNRFELVFNERDDAADLKLLPIGKCKRSLEIITGFRRQYARYHRGGRNGGRGQ